MIYNTFKDLEYYDERTQEYIKSTKEHMASYIKDILSEVYTVELTVENYPIVLLRKKDDVIICHNLSLANKDRSTIADVNYEMLRSICKELHNMHLVEEYGEEGGQA